MWSVMVAQGGKNTIVVLDGPKVIATIPWPIEPSIGHGAQIIIQPKTEQVYIIDPITDKIYLIEDLQVTTILDAGYAPMGGAIHPDSGRLYVANLRTAPPANSESPGPGEVIVIQNTEVITHIPLEFPHTLTFNEFDRKIYVGQENPFGKGSKNILVAIDDATLMTQTIYPADYGGSVIEVVGNRQNGHMYMTRDDFGLVIYWDREKFHRIDVGTLGYSINTIAVDSRNNWLYAASWDGPPSHVVVIEEGEVIAELPVEYDVRDIVIDETHDYVYATNYRSASMSVIHGTEVITTLSTYGAGPKKIAVDETRGYIYVTNADYANVAVFGFAEADKSNWWQSFLPTIQR